MDSRRRPQRRIGNRNSNQSGNKGGKGTTGMRRRRLVNRRNRRLGQGVNRRNRLQRAQGAMRNNRRNGRMGRRGRFFSNRRRNFGLRKVFVGGLARSVNNRELYRLFRIEGRLLSWRVSYDRYGGSRGFGWIEFANPRDAWRSIRKWNGTNYKGLVLRVEYRKRRRRQRRMNNGGFGFGNPRGFNNRGYFGNRGGYNRGFGGNRRGGRGGRGYY